MVFTPKSNEQVQATVKISVADNQYEDRIIQIIGEGYQDDITLDNIPVLFKDDSTETMLEEEDVSGEVPSFHMVWNHCWFVQMLQHVEASCLFSLYGTIEHVLEQKKKKGSSFVDYRTCTVFWKFKWRCWHDSY